MQVLRGDEAREFLRGMNAPLFYSQSLSLGEFLSERAARRVCGRWLTGSPADGRWTRRSPTRAAAPPPSPGA